MLWTILWIIGIPIVYALIYIYLEKDLAWLSLIWPVSVPVIALIFVSVLFLMLAEKGIEKFNKHLDKFKDEK